MQQQVRHLAIIMDGNGRWAKQRKKPRTYGHYVGSENVRTITIKANELGIEVLTLYAFSTENWLRPAGEVDYLMKLPKLFFASYLAELMANNVKVMTIGDLSKLPQETVAIINAGVSTTGNNSGLILNFAMNYGSRAEMFQATKDCFAALQADSGLQLSPELWESKLATADLPPVDLLIRTGGEKRLSNFLLYQLAYSELIFLDVAWPDFSTEILQDCLAEFGRRQRRYGGLKT